MSELSLIYNICFCLRNIDCACHLFLCRYSFASSALLSVVELGLRCPILIHTTVAVLLTFWWIRDCVQGLQATEYFPNSTHIFSQLKKTVALYTFVCQDWPLVVEVGNREQSGKCQTELHNILCLVISCLFKLNTDQRYSIRQKWLLRNEYFC